MIQKSLNLIKDPWLPIRRLDGSTEKIAILDILSAHDSNPVMDIVTVRPDFKNYVTEMLIGVINYAFPWNDSLDWSEKLIEPYSDDMFKSALLSLVPYFDLYGNDQKIHFMQEGTLAADVVPIEQLFVEDRGGWFTRNTPIQKICPSCAALALCSFNFTGRAGGNGYMTGIRGGGPLSTLLRLKFEGKENTLWRQLYTNTLPKESLESLNQHGLPEEPKNVFPWAGPLRHSETKTMTAPTDTNCYHIFFSMSNRFLLAPPLQTEDVCDACGDAGHVFFDGVKRKNKGVNYTGTWRHPFSPYQPLSKDGTYIALKGKRAGLTYRDWPAIVTVAPASVLRNEKVYYDARSGGDSEIPLPKAQASLYCYAYDVDNAKTRCWYSKTMPCFHFEKEYKKHAEEYLNTMLNLTTEILYYLKQALKTVRYKDLKNSTIKDWRQLETEFYEATEKDFFRNVQKLTQDKSFKEKNIAEQWKKNLTACAMKLYESSALSTDHENTHWDRIHRAGRILAGSCHNGKKITEIINNIGM